MTISKNVFGNKYLKKTAEYIKVEKRNDVYWLKTNENYIKSFYSFLSHMRCVYDFALRVNENSNTICS